MQVAIDTDKMIDDLQRQLMFLGTHIVDFKPDYENAEAKMYFTVPEKVSVKFDKEVVKMLPDNIIINEDITSDEIIALIKSKINEIVDECDSYAKIRIFVKVIKGFTYTEKNLMEDVIKNIYDMNRLTITPKQSKELCYIAVMAFPLGIIFQNMQLKEDLKYHIEFKMPAKSTISSSMYSKYGFPIEGQDSNFDTVSKEKIIDALSKAFNSTSCGNIFVLDKVEEMDVVYTMSKLMDANGLIPLAQKINEQIFTPKSF